MGQTIQAFIDKIRTEGVQAGQKEAGDLLTQAKQQAEQIIAQADQDKGKILADAKTEADNILTRGKTELALASRDAVGKLRDALGRAVQAVLAGGARATLEDEAFVGEVLHEIITQYGQNELGKNKTFQINVPDAMRQNLVEWALAHLGQDDLGGEHMTIDLKGTLSQAGFEYSASDATVEVTVDSVVEVLSGLVGPTVREILDAAMAENKG